MNKPIVSICCMTYNHEYYIRQCLDGFVMQQTNFDFEILVHEDASTDNTASLLREYEAKYPYLFRCVYQTENQFYKQNTLVNILFKMARGKYIALCEGDDYWTDPFKLQKQVDFLEANEEYSICSGNVICKNEMTGNVICKNEMTGKEVEWLGSSHREISTLRDILRYGSSVATCTLVFRNYKELLSPDWFSKVWGGDWALQIICTNQGKMKYFKEIMGVYRKNEGGYSGTMAKSFENAINYCELFWLITIKILSENFSLYIKELKAHEAEYWYKTLFYLYVENRDKQKAKNALLCIGKQLPRINISYLDFLKMVILYCKIFRIIKIKI